MEHLTSFSWDCRRPSLSPIEELENSQLPINDKNTRVAHSTRSRPQRSTPALQLTSAARISLRKIPLKMKIDEKIRHLSLDGSSKRKKEKIEEMNSDGMLN